MSNRNGKAKETAKKKSKQKRGWQQLPNEPADVYALLTRFFTQDTGTPAPGRRYSREPRTCERLAAELDAERAAKDAAESAVLSGPPSGTNQPPKSAAPAGGS